MSIVRLTHRILASTAIAAGLALGPAAGATAQPVSSNDEDDFLQCVVDHQDTDGIGICCVVYGGDYDEQSGECFIGPATPAPTSTTTRPAKKPVLTNVSRPFPVAVGRRA